MPKAAKERLKHSASLSAQLKNDKEGIVSESKRAKRKRELDNDEETSEQVIGGKLGQQIMTMAREQQESEYEEESSEEEDEFKWRDNREDEMDESDEEYEEEEYEEYDEEEIVGVATEDQELFNTFANSGQRRNLADLITAKLAAHENRVQFKDEQSESRPPPLPPKVVEVYQKVGLLLSRYKSGKLPKAFKIIPSTQNWETILMLTSPQNWTPHATYEATRLFVSNLDSNQAQKFLNLILLDKVRDDIAENKKLNYHLYMALKKSLYKPGAFFKGFLFPLCQSGNCTLKEAVIVSSVISKVSIPVLHSAAALLFLAEMPYTGPNSLMIRVLLEKGYALPYKVLDSLVFHFLRLFKTEKELPVLFHQSLLSFAQRYKNDITQEQREALLEVNNGSRGHHAIGPEVKRELLAGESRVDPDERMDVE